MAAAGADVFRVNCAHSEARQTREIIAQVRSAVPTAGVLVDIQGPKLRTGSRKLVFGDGETVRLVREDFNFDPYGLGVQAGEAIFLGDGTVHLEVSDIGPDGVLVRVVRGGACAPRRGVNLPDTSFSVNEGIFGVKDREDIAVARDAGADWLALSFVGAPGDVLAARAIAGDIPVIAKIERRRALENLSAIGEVSDGLMVARGDLGVEMPFESVPFAQQRIADWGASSGKVTICATEMLESMRTAPRPTRAEVSDVAIAVQQGYAAVMLSAETAVGCDPVGVVATMRSICDGNEAATGHKTYADNNPSLSAVAAAAAALAKRTDARVILALTYTGFSAEILSACRPPARIIAATPDTAAARRLRLHWGVSPVVVPRHPDMAMSVDAAVAASRASGLLTSGDSIVVTASRTSPSTPSDTIWTYQVP